MSFCIECGRKLVDDAKFCDNCGSSVQKPHQEQKRETVFEGELHKCPSCGELLKAFLSVCPLCGYEIRGGKSSKVVKEFSEKINEIESKRTPDSKFSSIMRSLSLGSKSPIDEQILSLIRNFSVPNTKEDAFEFMILASSNINSTALSANNFSDAGANSIEELNMMKAQSEAWLAKVEQVYHKAKLSFGEDADFIKIQELYDETTKSVRKAKKIKKNQMLILGMILVGLGVIFVLFFVGLANNHDIKEKKLQSIVVEIQQDIKSGNYDVALIKANTLHMDDDWSDESKAAWDKQREYLINLIEKEKNN